MRGLARSSAGLLVATFQEAEAPHPALRAGSTTSARPGIRGLARGLRGNKSWPTRGWQLVEEGEDIGRFVAVTDDARAELVQAVVARDDGEPADQVRHALALFRQRGADRHQKRSAVAALALVLEERRHNVLTEALAKSDSGALFDIANKFHVRHQGAKQKRDYDEFCLDWIFWLYLASIELTNRVIDEQTK
jgi:hypothetical protein